MNKLNNLSAEQRGCMSASFRALFDRMRYDHDTSVVADRQHLVARVNGLYRDVVASGLIADGEPAPWQSEYSVTS